MLKVAITISTSLVRWLTLEVIMIEIEPNTPKLDRLRVINKLELDYNLILKHYSYYLVTYHVDKYLILQENQWVTKSRQNIYVITLLDEVIIEIHCLSSTFSWKFKTIYLHAKIGWSVSYSFYVATIMMSQKAFSSLDYYSSKNDLPSPNRKLNFSERIQTYHSNFSLWILSVNRIYRKLVGFH